MVSLGLRDVVGPVMVGPSSSHTAGALRIAYMARRLAAARPVRVEFRLLGSFAHTLVGHGTDQALVAGMHAFFQTLGIEKPVFVGASDGGMVAQIYVQKYPGETGGLILISTGGMDANTLKSLKRKYFFAPLMLWYIKHCNYEKLKPRLIKAGMSHIRNESADEIAYAENMFVTIFKDFTQEKDVHISGLLADLMNQTPVTEADFAALAGKILLILPDQDFFSGEMQADLIRLMHDPQIAYVSGGHLSTVLRADDYIRTIRAFLEQ